MSDTAALQVFYRVREHLVRQNEVSTLATGECAYRGVSASGQTLKCAVGCLIQDEHYDPAMEGAGIRNVGVTDGSWRLGNPDCNDVQTSHLTRALSASGVPATESVRRLLYDLQVVHDQYDPWEWPEHLDRIHDRLKEEA